MSLKEIFCQDKAISVLQRAFATGKVPHAYIFAGPEGVGKFKTACEWAKLLLCKNPVIENMGKGEFADSCGSCRSCQLLEAGTHPDFNHVYKELIQFTKEGKDKKTPVDLPIDVVRQFLIDKVSTRPTLSERKVFVISEAEKLNAASQNCLLKVLEEPPGYCCIILVCTRLERLLSTIKSRCQIIRFWPVAEDRIIEKVKEMGVEQKKAQYLARLGGGSLGQACRWAGLELAGTSIYQIKKNLVSRLATYQFADALELAGQLLDEAKKIATTWSNLDHTTSKTDINRRAQKTLVQIIISALHDVIKLSVLRSSSFAAPATEKDTTKDENVPPRFDLVNFDQKEQIKKLANRFDLQPTFEKIADCYKMLVWIDSNVNEKLIFEHLLLNLADSDKIAVGG